MAAVPCLTKGGKLPHPRTLAMWVLRRRQEQVTPNTRIFWFWRITPKSLCPMQSGGSAAAAVWVSRFSPISQQVHAATEAHCQTQYLSTLAHLSSLLRG